MRQDKSYSICNFSNIPQELRSLNRWVVQRNKRPYSPEALNSLADVTDPSTWSTFQNALTTLEEGTFDGLGIVLNADGVVGIDLDHCVENEQPSRAATEILDEIGCAYVEFSPSGTGLRAFGYYHGKPLPGIRRNLKGLNLEMYCRGRFLTVTGNVFKSGPLQVLSGFKKVYDQIAYQPKAIANTEEDKAIASVSSLSSVSSVSSVSDLQIPPVCIPSGVGQRHSCIFRFARFLKSRVPNATCTELEALLQRWWVVAEPNVRTKDFGVSLVDFHHAWNSVKFPEGQFLDKVLAQLPNDPPDNPGSFLGPIGRKLFHFCALLTSHQVENFGDDIFFLSSRSAAEAIGTSHVLANTTLRVFVQRGLLEVVQKNTTHKAARYRLKLRG